MQIINKRIEIPKTENLNTEYISKYTNAQNFIRWAIVDVTETKYVIDGAVIVN